MSKGHQGVRELIEGAAKSLADDIRFIYAVTSDFNQLTDKKYPFVTLDLLTAVPQYTVNGVQNYMKAWTCSMAFYQLDERASAPEEYTLILDQMDKYVDKFVNKLNFYTDKSDHVLIQNISQQAFIKATADILTGHLLSFTLFVEDEFDYCADDLPCEVESDCPPE